MSTQELFNTGAKVVAVCMLSAALAACGGGGGGVSSTPLPPNAPPPPPPPPPATATSVSIFSNPKPGEFTSVGVTELANGNLSKADGDLVHIRYNSAGHYEIQMPGDQWEQLTIAKGYLPADPSTANYFQPASAPQNAAGFITSVSKTKGYLYSELGSWFDSSGRHGVIAFGEATPAGQVPVSGSATYNGLVTGSSDVVGLDDFLGGPYNVPVDGAVQLTFDFGNGTLGGSMTLALNPYSGLTPLGTFTFKETVYSVGSTNYSGKFDTNVAGSNYFFGQFTGPNAEETIGAWALPFVFSGQNHQGFGGWIAKQ